MNRDIISTVLISLHGARLTLYNTHTTWYFPTEISEINLQLTLYLSTKLTNPPFSFMHAFSLLFPWMAKYLTLIKNSVCKDCHCAPVKREKNFGFLAEKTFIPTIHLSSFSPNTLFATLTGSKTNPILLAWQSNPLRTSLNQFYSFFFNYVENLVWPTFSVKSWLELTTKLLSWSLAANTHC